MESVRAYVLSVTSAALICALVKSLTAHTGSGKTVHSICGLFLLFTVLNPLPQIRVGNPADWIPGIRSDAETAAEEGKNYAQMARDEIIKQETKAYILDKAALYDADLEVEVILSDTQPAIPAGVTIRGRVSPYLRTQLTRIIVEDLGIPKEAQRWNP